MTIEEAIKHCREKAEELANASGEAELQGCDREALKCSKCAEEHRQLAEWLKDYKRLLEPKTGHWIKEKTIDGWDGHSYQCSVCGRSIHLDAVVEVLADYPYCHCGAKMQAEREE